MSKIFHSIERELINYAKLKFSKKHKILNFHWSTQIDINDDMFFLIEPQIVNSWTSKLDEEYFVRILPIGDNTYYGRIIYDICLIQLINNKIKNIFIYDDESKVQDCDDQYVFEALLDYHKNLKDVMLYLRMQLGLTYSDIKKFEKNLKIFNIAYL